MSKPNQQRHFGTSCHFANALILSHCPLDQKQPNQHEVSQDAPSDTKEEVQMIGHSQGRLLKEQFEGDMKQNRRLLIHPIKIVVALLRFEREKRRHDNKKISRFQSSSLFHDTSTIWKLSQNHRPCHKQHFAL